MNNKSFRTKILIRVVAVTFVLALGLFAVSQFIEQEYVNTKTEELKSLILIDSSNNTDFLKDNADAYGIDYQEFTSKTEVEKYLSEGQLGDENFDFSTFENIQYAEVNEAFVVKDGENYSVYHINEEFVNDINKVIFILVGISIAAVFFIAFSVLTYIDTRVFKKILAISDMMKTGKNIDNITFDNDEIGYLYKTTVDYKTKLDNEEQERLLLSRAIAHEMKNPLANLNAIMYLTENNEYTLTEAKAMINDETQMLSEKIDTLLDVYTIEQKKYKISELISNHTYSIEKRKLKLKVEGSVDTVLISYNTIIFDNIISNAVKYSISGSEIKLSISENQIRIENMFDGEVKRPSNGTRILEQLVTKQKADIRMRIKDNVYTVCWNFN